MTKEQIIGALKAAAKPYEEDYIDDEVVDAIKIGIMHNAS